MKNKKQLKILSLIIAIILCCFFSTIAYSAIYTTMGISGLAYARPIKDVRVTGFKLNNLQGRASVSYTEFSKNTLSLNVNILDNSSKAVFDVEIINYGSADIGILQIVDKSSSGAFFNILNYEYGNKLCDSNGKCNNMAVSTIQIEVRGSAGEHNVNLEVDFRTFHSVTYTGITNNNYPIEVIDGGNLNVTFTENLKKVSVLADGTEVNYYDSISSGQTITLENVSSDIEFKVDPPVARLVSGKIDEVGSEVCIKDECFYIISNDGTTVSMFAKYNLHVGGVYDNNTDTYTSYGSEQTGKQNSTMVGFDASSLVRYGVTKYSEINSAYSGSLVEGYVNSYKNILNSYRANVTTARLITYDELLNVGCSNIFMHCSETYSWVISSSYWASTIVDDAKLWAVDTTGYFGYAEYNYDRDYGVRPVIEMSVGDIYIYVEPAAKVVSGDLDTVGSEVAIGDEHFYVISSTNDSVTMFAKYNLYVGKECGTALNSCTSYGEEATGRQDSTMLGWGSTSPYRGVIEFSNVSCNYSGSIVECYVNNYHSYLITQNITPIGTRLIFLMN